MVRVRVRVRVTVRVELRINLKLGLGLNLAEIRFRSNVFSSKCGRTTNFYSSKTSFLKCSWLECSSAKNALIR